MRSVNGVAGLKAYDCSPSPLTEQRPRLRRIVINQLRNAPDKHSLKTRRYLCSLDKQYLLDRLKQ